MHTTFKHTLTGLITFSCLSFVNQSSVEACGGFFCNQQPVEQTGEQIIFAVNETNNTVQVDIQIGYTGLAEDFAWLLPLTEEPTSIKTGSTRAFQVVDMVTAPQFRLEREERGTCKNDPRTMNFPSGGAFDAASASDAGSGGSVTVLQRSNVGPYDSVVLEGTNPQAVRQWLEENEYRVTDEMMDAIVPYIAKGDVLLALKMLKDTSSGEIQPISLTIPGNELCIPLRLTAIAAQNDMDVTAFAFSSQGRAVPTNYLHFTPNWTRLDWVRWGNNYRQLIGDAADEAGGNAFTTEFASPTEKINIAPFQLAQFSIGRMYRQLNLLDLLDYIQGTNLRQRSEFRGILRSFITDDDLEAAGLEPDRFWRCPQCYREQVESYEPFNSDDFANRVSTPLQAAVEERIIEPERRMLNTFRTSGYLTRLFTLISPAEMGLDPIFEFRNGLPDVSNQHSATLVTTCNEAGDVSRRHLELEDDTVVELDAMSTMPSSTLNQMPAVATVRDFSADQPVILVDNRANIKAMAALPSVRSSNCSCGVTQDRGGAVALGFALLGLGFLRRRRR